MLSITSGTSVDPACLHCFYSETFRPFMATEANLQLNFYTFKLYLMDGVRGEDSIK